jgi:hypothetical protein
MIQRNIELLIFGAAGLCATLGAGCGAPVLPRVELVQPQMPGSQSRLSLSTEQAVWADGAVLRVEAEFPLPGASTGRPAYIVYLRLPASATTQPAGIGRQAGGFLIQTRGANAGLADIAAGTVGVTKESSERLAVRVDVTCEDGTQLKGEWVARRDDLQVQAFERHQRAADVEKLRRRMGS